LRIEFSLLTVKEVTVEDPAMLNKGGDFFATGAVLAILKRSFPRKLNV